MLASWGRWVYRFRWWVVVVSVLSLVPAAWLAYEGGHLEAVAVVANSESARALDLMKKELPPSYPSFGLIFRSPSLKAGDPEFKAGVEQALAPLRGDPLVQSIRTAYDGAKLERRDISVDGHSMIATVEISDYGATQTRLAMKIYPALRARVHSDTLEVVAFGPLPSSYDLTVFAEKDAKQAEMRVLPLVGLLLLFVFGSFVGAALPLAAGLLAVTAGMAGSILLARVTPVLAFSKNVVVMVGLGVAIDYSLFILSRFREQVGLSPVAEALASTMATTGRAILFSGVAVAIGLLGMLLLGLGPVGSLGLAGAIAVLLAVAYAMTFIPGLLAVLGPRVDSLRVPFVNRDKTGRSGWFWPRLAIMVMAHPWKVLVSASLCLILLGLPFLHIRLGANVGAGLPRTAESRRGMELLRGEFRKVDTNPVIVVIRYPKSYTPLSVEHVEQLYDLSRRLAKLPGVNEVKSIVDLDPSISRGQYVDMFTPPTPPLPKGVQRILKEMVGENIVMVVVQTSLPEAGSKALALVRAIRESHPRVGGKLMVTGESAFEADFTDAVKKNSPLVIGFIVFATYFVLFLLLRSVLLPLKAVLMNMLSLSASYGALVWIFQDGHLATFLHFTPGPIESMTPIIMFCVLFGLSMDYEVILLSRVREEYERGCDNTRAVAAGLERTGQTITGAAAIMALVLFTFGFADITTVKEMGVGMGIAVVVDATIVRSLLVPATMRLLGDWNWWAPGSEGAKERRSRGAKERRSREAEKQRSREAEKQRSREAEEQGSKEVRK
ncbi:MAG: MMPL family transporter [Syntrophobacteraceae bacterium]|nr:MMPL family transporter [Syntrophobacteraceae bacterium]